MVYGIVTVGNNPWEKKINKNDKNGNIALYF